MICEWGGYLKSHITLGEGIGKNMKRIEKTAALGNELFLPGGNPTWRRAFPLAMQHVVSMIVGCVTPAIIVANIALEQGEITASDVTMLVQAALLISGIATMLQIFSWKHRIGSGLPVIMGVSFAYLASLEAIAMEFNLATLFGAQLAGGVIAIIVGVFIGKIRFLFPPLVSGTVVFVIGLSLYPTAVNYMAGGAGSADFGSWKNWLVALVVLIIVTVLNHYGMGIWKLSSILIGMAAGYLLAAVLGMVSLDAVHTAPWVQMIEPLHFGLRFEISPIITMAILYVVNSVQAIGDLTATAVGGLNREPEEKELSGGIIGNGLGSILGAVIGGLPTATFSQNVGIVTTTKVVARKIFAITAGIIMIAGIIPKFASLLTTIPACVLGGATISVFASIAMTGMKLIAREQLNFRNTSIVGLSVALGMGVTLVPEALARFPSWVTMIFGKSPVVLATLSAVLLYQVLPYTDEDS